MTLQPWAGSAEVYDVLYGQMKDYEADVELIHTWIQARSPGASSLLDVACGTGLHLHRLKHFYDVVGVDLSDEMLAVAAERNPEVPLHSGDMRTFDLGTEFDAVTCLFSAIGYMPDVESLHAAIANMARHLATGGVLILEPWLDIAGWRDGHLDLMTYDTDDLKVARISSGVRQGDHVTINFHHMVLAKGEEIRYFTEEHPTTLFSTDQYFEAFTAAGLQTEHDPQGFIGRGMFFGVKG